jgi:hypothetical protein
MERHPTAFGEGSRSKDPIAEAEAVDIAEGNMWGPALRGSIAQPWSKTPSRIQGTRRNLGDLTFGRAVSMAPGGRIAICVATTILFRRALNISSLVFNHPLKPGQFGNTRMVKPVDFLEIQTQTGRERWYFLKGPVRVPC